MAMVLSMLIGSKSLSAGAKIERTGIDRLIAGELKAADIASGHVCRRHDPEGDVWGAALLDGWYMLEDVTERRFVGLGISNVDRATSNYVKSISIHNPIIDKKWWLAVPAIKGQVGSNNKSTRWRNYSSTGNGLETDASRVFGNSNVGHGGILNIESVYRVVFDSDRNISSWLTSRIDERDGKMDSLVNLQLLSKLSIDWGEPRPLRGFQSAHSFPNAPYTYYYEQDGSCGHAEMSVWDIFFKIVHILVTGLLFAAGVFFDVLMLVCLAPICCTIFPNIFIRWSASLSCLALSIILLAAAFSRGI